MVETEDQLHRSLVALTGFLNRPQADAVLLRQAGSSLDRALFPLLIRASVTAQTVGELADSVGRHHTTVSRQITALEQQGLVERTSDPADGRRAVVAVTSKGRQEAARIAEVRNEAMAAALADWNAGDRADLARLLDKLVRALEATLAAAQPGITRRDPTNE